MVSGKVLMYRDMFFDYDILIRQGAKKMTALQTTADRYSVSVQTIYRAIKWMQG
jgi:DNA invertase Pin-like site-specific DNA recombinase